MEARKAEIRTIESVYGLIQEGNWDGALQFIHSSEMRWQHDARMAHLMEIFVTEFFRRLPDFNLVAVDRDGPGGSPAPFDNDAQAAAAERMILFHTAGRLQLASDAFGNLIVRLVLRHRDQPERALDFARFLPDHPVCGELLRPFTTPEKRSTPSVRNTGVHLTEQATKTRRTVANGLFRSMQEREFYEAVREAYPDLLAIPNTSLQTVVSFQAVRKFLTVRERDYFFRSLIDCVLFDPGNDFRPVVCFELDSPVHEDDQQIQRDDMKDRILSLAGVRLIRLRPERSGVGADAYRKVLSTLGSLQRSSDLE